MSKIQKFKKYRVKSLSKIKGGTNGRITFKAKEGATTA